MQSDYSGADSLAGSILVASPSLRDPNFQETLVYLAQHDLQGALGLVMNRPLGKSLREIVQAVSLSPSLADVPVMYGGPVRPNSLLVAVFERDAEGGIITCRLDLSLEQADAYLEEGHSWVRAFVGYSGWGEGQLEGEIAQEAWKIRPVEHALFDARFSFGLWSLYVSGDDRWRRLQTYFPDSPSDN